VRLGFATSEDGDNLVETSDEHLELPAPRARLRASIASGSFQYALDDTRPIRLQGQLNLITCRNGIPAHVSHGLDGTSTPLALWQYELLAQLSTQNAHDGTRRGLYFIKAPCHGDHHSGDLGRSDRRFCDYSVNSQWLLLCVPRRRSKREKTVT
jgi:hypothetical protein